MPESSTAIVTSGRPVVVCQAVSTEGSRSTRDAPRTPPSSRGSAFTSVLPGSGVAAYITRPCPEGRSAWSRRSRRGTPPRRYRPAPATARCPQRSSSGPPGHRILPGRPPPARRFRRGGSVRAAGPVGTPAVPALAAPARLPLLERQADDRLRLVVVLVRLVDPVLGIGDVDVGEAATQTGHVDPLLRVGGRVDVGPADRGAQRDPLGRRVRAAGGVDRAARRAAQARPRVAQVAQAVGDLGPRADVLGPAALRVEPP